MNSMSYSSFRGSLAAVLDQVNDDHKPVLITRREGRSAVIMSLEDFHAYEETAYLMASPKNAARLNQAIANVSAGKITQYALFEDQDAS